MLRYRHSEHHGKNDTKRWESNEVVHRFADHFGDVLPSQQRFHL